MQLLDSETCYRAVDLAAERLFASLAIVNNEIVTQNTFIPKLIKVRPRTPTISVLVCVTYK